MNINTATQLANCKTKAEWDKLVDDNNLTVKSVKVNPQNLTVFFESEAHINHVGGVSKECGVKACR